MDRRLQLIISEIAQNHSIRPHLPELAAKVNLTVRRVEQLFKAEMGTTLGAYNHTQRMKWARKRLWETNQPVKKVASDLGYSAVESFGRKFKRVHGCTATQFRRRRGRVKQAK